MKRIKDMLRRIGTAGLAAIMLTAQMPVTAFAEEIAEPQAAVGSDEVLPAEVQMEDVLPGETPLTEKDASEKTADEESSDPVEKKEEGVDAQEAQESDKKDADGDKKKEEQTASEEEERPAFSESKSIDGVRITVEAEEGVFPEGATLSAEKVTLAQEKQAEEAVESERDEDKQVAASYTYDIKVLDQDGNEIQPAGENGEDSSSRVKVSFKLDEVADKNLETNVYHITENGNETAESNDVSTKSDPDKEEPEESESKSAEADSLNDTDSTVDGESASRDSTDGRETTGGIELVAEKLPVETDGDTATAETDGFSLYTVEFTYDNKQYVLPGDSEVALSEVLNTVGLTGDVSDVEVSDESLFSAKKCKTSVDGKSPEKDEDGNVIEDENGTWFVFAHQAFSTEEWMKVTIGGVVYEITVTDTETSISKLYVGGSAEVTTVGEIAGTGASSGKASVSVEDGSVVLTLDNFVYNGQGNSGGGNGNKLYSIYYDGSAPLIIDLIGTNSIIHDDNYNSGGYVIRGYTDLTIRSTNGSGSLTVSNTNKAYSLSCGILNNGNITFASGTFVTTSQEGIYAAGGDVILAGATVTSSNYTYGTDKAVKVAAGKTYYVNETPYTGTLTDDQLIAIAGQTMICPTTTLTASVAAFESVTAGSYTPVVNPVTIANTGSIGATIESVTLSGDGAEAFELNKTDGATIAAGATDNTTYTVSPKSSLAAGTYTATVTVLYGGDQTATSDVSIIVVAPEDYVTVKAPSFDNAYGNYAQPTAKSITLNNLGGSTVTINSVTLTGTNAGSFRLNKTDNTTISASTTDNTTYTIRPNAGLSVGTYEATISVTYATNKTATADVSFLVDNPLAVIAPTFENAADGYYEINAKEITIDNSTGIEAKEITSVTLTGTNADSFTLNKTTGMTITAGATDTSYTVKPNWRLTTGNYTATVNVTYNGGAIATADVSFTVTDGSRSGTLGTVAWEISEDWKTLTFRGTGVVSGFGLSKYFAKRIETIIFSEGITGIGECALTSDEYYNFNNANSVTLPSTLTSIYRNEFSACPNLATIHFGGTKTEWDAVSKADAQIPSTTKVVYNIASCTFSDIADQTYTGSAIKPVVTITDGENTLTLGTNYTIEYSENINAGTANATITGTGAYEGTVTATFTIKPKSVKVSGITASDKTYDGTTDATLNYAGAAFDGICAGDALTVTATGAFENADAGIGKTVNISDITLGGSSASNYVIAAGSQRTATASISKADSTVTTNPTEISGLVYNATAQKLVTAGSATGGTFYYALGTATEATEPYTTTIPTATNAGTYYVWYKVVGDANHNDVAAQSITVIIGKAQSGTAWTRTVEVQKGNNIEASVSILGFVGTNASLVGDPTVDSTTGSVAASDFAISSDKKSMTFKVTSVEGGEGNVTATLSSDNYESFTLKIPVQVKAKTTEVKLEYGQGFESSVQSIEVSGLDALTNTLNGTNVKVELDVKLESEPFDGTVNEKIKNDVDQIFSGVERGSVKKEYLDISVKQTVDSTESTVADVGRVIEIAVKFDLTGKYNPVVVREHGGSVARFTALALKPGSGYTDGTYYVDNTHGTIYIYTRYFSTYTIAYATVNSYMVSFDAQGGSSVQDIVVTAGGNISTLPTSTRSGYSFDGWFTSSSGGNQLTTSTTINENVTYYAHWTQSGSGGGGETPTPEPTPAPTPDPTPTPTPDPEPVNEKETKTVKATATYKEEKITVSANMSWDSEITYTGNKITPSDLGYKLDLSDLYDEVKIKKGNYEPKDLFKVTYVLKNNLHKSTAKKKASLYAKITLNEKTAKKAGLTRNEIARLKAIIKALNKQLKKTPCVYTIDAVDLDAAGVEIVADVTWTKKGKIKKAKSIRVTAYVNGEKKTFKLKSGQYKISVKDASAKTVKITGKKDFTGTVIVNTK